MFESETRLRRDVQEILESLRGLGGGWFAAVFEKSGILVESVAEARADAPELRHLLQAEAEPLLRLPGELQSGEADRDLFAGFARDEFLLAVVNGKVGVLAACADARRLEAESAPLLRALVDRLLRLDARFRYDEKGRGIFFGSPRLDTVVIPRPEDVPDS
jgi:hypothetical protein